MCAITVSLFIRIKVHEQGREEELMEKKKEAEELNRFQELYNKEQNKRKQKNKEEKGNIMKAYQVITSQTGGSKQKMPRCFSLFRKKIIYMNI